MPNPTDPRSLVETSGEKMICPDCEGSGELAGYYFASDGMSQCERCRGTGLIPDDEDLTIPHPTAPSSSDEMPEDVAQYLDAVRAIPRESGVSVRHRTREAPHTRDTVPVAFNL